MIYRENAVYLLPRERQVLINIYVSMGKIEIEGKQAQIWSTSRLKKCIFFGD